MKLSRTARALRSVSPSASCFEGLIGVDVAKTTVGSGSVTTALKSAPQIQHPALETRITLPLIIFGTLVIAYCPS